MLHVFILGAMHCICDCKDSEWMNEWMASQLWPCARMKDFLSFYSCMCAVNEMRSWKHLTEFGLPCPGSEAEIKHWILGWQWNIISPVMYFTITSSLAWHFAKHSFPLLHWLETCCLGIVEFRILPKTFLGDFEPMTLQIPIFCGPVLGGMCVCWISEI